MEAKGDLEVSKACTAIGTAEVRLRDSYRTGCLWLCLVNVSSDNYDCRLIMIFSRGWLKSGIVRRKDRK